MNDMTDETAIETGERHMTVRRTFDASRERVWDAWTDSDQIDQWWGPDGFTTTTDEMDATPGGVWEFEMIGPDGEEYPNRIVYDEVERPERLAYTHGSPDDPEMFRVTVTFDERAGNTTELTMESRYPSAEDLDDALEFGADEGAAQTLGRLDEHLRRLDTTGGGEH
ncbi:SRPBCC domain-containing protein [Natrinema gelatinilyticum]|uniref:SRPBCC domain-containing protein n=1 Tax=Natrinema gelatinilyticum TaxID=2961571 RepID=UPI0020C52FC6|nr:SRPBCC domain-containing protein [Natrinema gelatinilyticum]